MRHILKSGTGPPPQAIEDTGSWPENEVCRASDPDTSVPLARPIRMTRQPGPPGIIRPNSG